jgi:hypothetical protein
MYSVFYVFNFSINYIFPADLLLIFELTQTCKYSILLMVLGVTGARKDIYSMLPCLRIDAGRPEATPSGKDAEPAGFFRSGVDQKRQSRGRS